MSESGSFRKHFLPVVLPPILALLLFTLALTVIPSAAKAAPSVDPETKRHYSYTGNAKVGLWLNSFDENGACTGDAYAVFNAGAPFNQFGFPNIWAGRSENGADADYIAEIYAFDESPEKSIGGSPLFSETMHQDGDNTHGAIFPMQKILPAGKYVLYVRQLTAKTTDADPYIVLPTGTAAKTTDFMTFGGTSGGVLCFFIDFIKDADVIDYFFPLEGASGINLTVDEPVTVFRPESNSGADRLEEGETYAVLTSQIPDDRILYSITFFSMPTWSNNGPGSNLSYEVYRWNTSYVYSTSYDPVLTGEVVDHRDNQPLDLSFGYSLEGGSRYLIVLKTSGPKSIGFWIGPGEIQASKWRVYKNGMSADGEDLPGFSYTTAALEYVEIDPSSGETASPAVPNTPSPSPYTDPTTAPANSSSGGCGSFTLSPIYLILPAAIVFIPKPKEKS